MSKELPPLSKTLKNVRLRLINMKRGLDYLSANRYILSQENFTSYLELTKARLHRDLRLSNELG
jgi:hypothetical protein